MDNKKKYSTDLNDYLPFVYKLTKSVMNKLGNRTRFNRDDIYSESLFWVYERLLVYNPEKGSVINYLMNCHPVSEICKRLFSQLHGYSKRGTKIIDVCSPSPHKINNKTYTNDTINDLIDYSQLTQKQQDIILQSSKGVTARKIAKNINCTRQCVFYTCDKIKGIINEKQDSQK